MYEWSGNPALLEVASELFDDCISLGRFADQDCAGSLARAYAFSGQIEAALEAAAAPSRPLGSEDFLHSLIDAGHIESALRLLRGEMDSGRYDVAAMAQLGALADLELITKSEELALSEQDSNRRDHLLRLIANNFAAVGNDQEASRVAALIEDLEERGKVIKGFAKMRAYGLAEQNRFGEAAAALRQLDDPSAAEVALWLSQRAVRQGLQ